MTSLTPDVCYAYPQQTAYAGTGLFASKGIPAGELVIRINDPLVSVPDSPHLTDTCSNCFAWVPKGQAGAEDEYLSVELKACTGCKIVRYCGKSCQSRAWKRHHKYECKLYKSLYPQVLPNTARMVIQVLLRRQAQILPDSDWSSFINLVHHIPEFQTESSPPERWETIQLISKAAYEYTNHAAPLPLIETITARLLLNTLTLVTPTYTPLGLCLSPLLALTNHSCTPNTVVSFSGPTLSLRSLLPIASTSEITISYIDTTNPTPTRLADLSRYHFTCACSACTTHTTSSHPDIPPSLTSTLPTSTLTALDSEAFSLLARAKSSPSPTDSLPLLRSALALFTPHTPAYPPWRQPFASLRQQYVHALLSTQAWIPALRHSLTIHFDIDPVLFPQPWHPVRVTHAWVLWRLIVHVAGLAVEGGGAAGEEVRAAFKDHPIDWPIVISALLRSVLANVGRSHGAESRLGRVVRAKAREVWGESADENENGRGDLGREDREWEKLRAVVGEVV